MNYGFDLDDTLVDTSEVLYEYAIKFDKEILKGSGKLKKIDSAKDYYHFAYALGWNSNNIEQFFDVYYIEMLKKIKVKPDVKEAIDELRKSGNKIYIITARREVEDNAVATITKNMLENAGIAYDGIFIDIHHKSDKVKELNVDVFVDDGYENCIDVKENTSAKVYMMETPFNKGIQDSEILKIKSIQEIL